MRFQIERYSEESSGEGVYQVASGHVTSRMAASDENFALPRDERLQNNLWSFVPAIGGRSCGKGEEHIPSIVQNLRAISRVRRLYWDENFGISAIGRTSHDALVLITEYNLIAAPTRVVSIRFANRCCGSTRDRHSLEGAIVKRQESDPTPVR